MDFKEYYFLTERAQQGFVYEQNVARELAKHGWVKPGYKPAGASHDRPDLDLFIKGKEYGCELKISLASAGSLVLNFNGPGKGYSFGETEGNVEKEFLKTVGETAGVLQEIKKKWRVDPWIQRNRDQAWVDRTVKSGLNAEERYRQDLENHPDIILSVPTDTISAYYNHKDTNYINIGTHGFYLLGNTDPAKLNKCANPEIPLWDDSHAAQLRVRIQYKGGMSDAVERERVQGVTAKGAQGYQITMELQFKTVTRSPYNVGAVKLPSVDIIGVTLPTLCKAK